MSPDSIGDSEPDMDPTPSKEIPQNPDHPNVTVPKRQLEKTDESLRILGAGSPYKPTGK
jgi:hypothetical protein